MKTMAEKVVKKSIEENRRNSIEQFPEYTPCQR